MKRQSGLGFPQFPHTLRAQGVLLECALPSCAACGVSPCSLALTMPAGPRSHRQTQDDVPEKRDVFFHRVLSVQSKTLQSYLVWIHHVEVGMFFIVVAFFFPSFWMVSYYLHKT